MKVPKVEINFDSEANCFVSYIPALNIYSAGNDRNEALAAVYDAAELSFRYLKEMAENAG